MHVIESRRKGRRLIGHPYEIPFEKRKPEGHQIGSKYFVSFDGRNVEEVKVISFLSSQPMLEVEITKGKNKGKIHKLYFDEVRTDPFQARINCIS